MHKGFFFLIAAGLVAGLTACAGLGSRPVGNTNVPPPAKSVELNRYLGLWYELYRYETPFQKDCEAVTANYSLNADGSIKVINSCLQKSGKIKTATGKAKIKDADTNAKLKVSFFWPFSGNYWVLDHADDYSWSIVGEPSGTYLWILSREPKPSAEAKAALLDRAQSLGYDVSMLKETRQ